jgi:hypothetical protein
LFVAESRKGGEHGGKVIARLAGGQL